MTLTTILLVPALATTLATTLAAAPPWVAGDPCWALDLAAREALPAVLDFTAGWCGKCAWMDRHVFADPEVSALLGAFIAVQVDGDLGDGARLARDHRVTGYPTLIVLGADGRELDRVEGKAGASEIARLLADHLDGPSTTGELAQRFHQGPTDHGLARRLLERHATASDTDAAMDLLQQVVDAQDDRGPPIGDRLEAALREIIRQHRSRDLAIDVGALFDRFAILFPPDQRDARRARLTASERD